MPTRYFNRIWCKTCNNFTLHVEHISPDTHHSCDECKTVYTEVKLSEIPEDKLVEQRKRYKAKQQKDHAKVWSMMGGAYGPFGGLNMLDDLFREDFPKSEIRESDAGQKQIDAAEKARRDAEYQERLRIREEQRQEFLRFKPLGRNDICACGSGSKYKKCCLQRIASYNFC